MADLEKLVRDVRTLESKLSVCTRCGVCQAACPLYAVTRKEADVSRGKLALIKGLADNLFDNAKGVSDRLDRCLLCGACSRACPSGVDTQQIFILARSIITKYLGLPFSRKLVFKKLLARPAAFNRVARMAVSFQSLLFKPEKNIQGTSCARGVSPLLRSRSIVPLKEKAFLDNIPASGTGSPGGVRVAFFVGCLIDKAFPDIAVSALDVLTHVNARVTVPEGQGCCGIPALAAGDTDTFEALVKTHVRLFSGHSFDYLVTACATCAATIIKLWPALMKDRDPGLLDRVKKLSGKTVDINWLLARRFRLAVPDPHPAGNDRTVTYHDPCHLKNTLGISDEPRMVIRAAGCRLKEMENSDACCGMGGSFNLKYYKISSEIGMKKAEAIAGTGCPVVAASCPACMIQLSDMLAQKRLQVAVKHPVSLLAESIRAAGKPSDR